MAFYGNDFASATLLNNYQSITDGEIVVGSNDHDFFRFTVSSATNRIFMHGRQGNHNTTLRLYDSTETEIDSNVENGDYFIYTFPENLPTGTYYIEYNPDNTFSEPYSFDFFLTENGNYPSITNQMIDIDSYSEADETFAHDVDVDLDLTRIFLAPVLPPYNQQFKTFNITMHNIGFTIPAEFYNQKIIMMGNRIGASVPVKIASSALTEDRYVLAGKVQENGVDLPGKTVRLYDRATGELLGETITDALGNYRFGNPLWQDSKYYVIAFDDLNAPILQAVIHDALIPFVE